jgi:large subunit ribosomal protein L14
MIQKNTLVYPIDKSGAIIGNVFHTYKGGKKKISKVGEFVKISLRKVKPDIKLKKKNKTKALIVRSKFKSIKLDGSFFLFYENSVVLIKRKLIMRSKEFIAPADKNIRRKKIIYKFPGIL